MKPRAANLNKLNLGTSLNSFTEQSEILATELRLNRLVTFQEPHLTTISSRKILSHQFITYFKRLSRDINNCFCREVFGSFEVEVGK